ncbi:MAG: ferritin family protein [Pseudomonadota bacterium]|nr:ferritin family protein [Pseudomonadota bacterium]
MKDRMNALEAALNNELREREFYLKNAERTKNPVGKAMFLQIAAEELEHYERLQELHEKWTKEGKWPETVPLKVKETKVRDILKKAVKEAGEATPGDADDRKALETAIDFEGQGATYYARLRDGVTDPREKAFFELLANIEHEHYVSLKDTEEYLLDPAAWFRKQERGGLDGA